MPHIPSLPSARARPPSRPRLLCNLRPPHNSGQSQRPIRAPRRAKTAPPGKSDASAPKTPPRRAAISKSIAPLFPCLLAHQLQQMLTPPAAHSCNKANKECVEQIPARERERQPKSAAELLEELRKSVRRDAGLIEKLSACPRDEGLDARIVSLIAFTKANVDALEAYRTPVPGPAAPAARAAPAAPPVGAPFAGPAAAAAATARKRRRVDEDEDDVAVARRGKAVVPSLPNHQAPLRLPGQHLHQYENRHITRYRRQMADVFPFVVVPEVPPQEGFLWEALTLSARYDEPLLQMVRVTELLRRVTESGNSFLCRNYNGGEDASRGLDMVQSLQVLLAWCCCSRDVRTVNLTLALMITLVKRLGIDSLNLWVDGEPQESPQRVRALLATYYLNTV